MAKLFVKKGDTVEVLSGKDKGVRGEVIRAYPSENKVLVRDVAVVKKATRPDANNQTGGIVEQESKIDASNVAVVCPACGEATRVGREDGQRVCKKCGEKF